jgi:hypothetical protein
MLDRKKKKSLTGRKNLFLVEAWQSADYESLSPILYAAAREQGALDRSSNVMMEDKQPDMGPAGDADDMMVDYEPHYFDDPYLNEDVPVAAAPQQSIDDEINAAITPRMVNLLDQSICLDCRYFGNISRFLRHRTASEAKLLDRRIVYDNFHENRYPRLALFAAKYIPAGSELYL